MRLRAAGIWGQGGYYYCPAVTAERARAAAAAAVEEHGWTVARVTRSGYWIMRCACGQHQETLHKSPRLPNHYDNKVRRMVSTCSTR